MGKNSPDNLDEKAKIEFLFKKWELLWNQYKLHNEGMEKRRNFHWIFHSSLFLAWYNLLCKYNFIAFIFSLSGLIISLLLFFVIRRDRESALLNEMELRDAENQLNTLYKEINFQKFNLNRKAFNQNKIINFRYSFEKYSKKERIEYWNFGRGGCVEKFCNFISDKIERDKFNKIRSNKFTYDFLIPIILMILWLFLFIYTIYARYTIVIKCDSLIKITIGG